jgi:hypothetical protein
LGVVNAELTVAVTARSGGTSDLKMRGFEGNAAHPMDEAIVIRQRYLRISEKFEPVKR